MQTSLQEESTIWKFKPLLMWNICQVMTNIVSHTLMRSF